jgi:hypothetical protein
VSKPDENMTDYLRNLVAAHNLRTIGISFFSKHSAHFSVYLHWDVGDEAECSRGSGETVDAALAAALSEMEERRYADSERAWVALEYQPPVQP